jgi:hypothetical protein
MAEMENIVRMSRDLRAAAATMKDEEARYLVDAYYQRQDDRKRAKNQARAMDKEHGTGEPHVVIDWLGNNDMMMEKQIHGALEKYAMAHELGRWMMNNYGIGPVISAGLLSTLNTLDPEKTNTTGKFWALCGQAPGQKRVAGQKLNYNPRLKTLAYHIGECVKKVCNKEEAFYGHIYKKRKEYEVTKNEKGDYAEQAAAALQGKKWKNAEVKKIYESGKLPPGHLDRRACRVAAKMFLSHVHELWYEFTTGNRPPAIYSIGHMGHTDYVAPPNRPWAELKRAAA